ncbi:hypothetical protein ACSRDC_17810, partial [Acinetobacter baumannii]
MTVKFRQYFLILIFGLLLSACQPAAKHNESLDSQQQAYTLHMGEKGIQDFSKYSRSLAKVIIASSSGLPVQR